MSVRATQTFSVHQTGEAPKTMCSGGNLCSTLDTVIKTAQTVDAYISAFPIEKTSEGEIRLSTPEAITLWSGVGAILLGITPFGAGLVIAATIMKGRRLYLNS